MKQISFFLIGLLAVLVAGCGFKSTETPINNNLLSFTAPDEASDGVLLGVKDKEGTVIVTPAAYNAITADENLIICMSTDHQYCVFGFDGTAYGVFESFEQITSNGSEYYRGISGELTSFYFPGKGIVNCTAVQITSQALFVLADNVWQVYAPTGDKLWDLPEGAILINGAKDIVIAVPEKGKKGGCKFYDIRGKVVKQLNAYKWRKFQKQLVNMQVVENLKIYQVAPLELQKLLPELSSNAPTDKNIFQMIYKDQVQQHFA